MSDDRLRRELEALERSAPPDLPPRPSVERRAAAAWRVVAPVATVVLAALLVAVVAPRWIASLSPAASPSGSELASASTDASDAPVPSPPPVLAWHVVSIDEPGAVFRHISRIEGRLILTGSLLGQPQAWWSDDEGATWRRSSPEGARPEGARPVGAGSLGQVAGTADRLVSFGTRSIGANDSEVLPVIWISDDFGERWRATDPKSIPQATVEVAWNGSRFLALTDTSSGAIDYVSNSIEVWASADGMAWEQVAGPEPFGLSVALNDVAQANGMTALALAGRDGTSELWLSDDGATWERSEARSGIIVRPERLGSNGNELVVVEWQEFPPGSLVRNLLWSTDGRSWTARALNLEHQPVNVGSWISAIIPGAHGVVLTGGLALRILAPERYWYLPDGADEARLLDVGIVDAVAVGDGFVGIHTCGPVADCAIALVYALPEGRHPPRPTIDREPPVPAPSARPFDDDPAEITGVLRGDAQMEIGCVWLTDAQGNRWEILWPEGYRHEFVDGVPTLMRDGAVVAAAGDPITVRGMRSRDLGSVCMVGIVYDASEVLLAR